MAHDPGDPLTDSRAPGVPQAMPTQREDEAVRFSTIRTLLRRLNWFGLNYSEHILLKQVLADYADLVVRADREHQQYELRIHQLETELRLVHLGVTRVLVRLKSVGSAVAAPSAPASKPHAPKHDKPPKK